MQILTPSPYARKRGVRLALTLYAIEDVGAGYYFASDGGHPDPGLRKHGVRVIDISDPSKPVKGNIFGEMGAWDKDSPETPSNLDERFVRMGLGLGPFAKSSITGLRVVERVMIGGDTRDVLLVTTRPWLDKEIISAADPEWGVHGQYSVPVKISHEK